MCACEPGALSATEELSHEGKAWAGIAEGWKPLFGRYRDLGFSFEWHDFQTGARDLDWSASFHPGSLEVCLNLTGEATLGSGGGGIRLGTESCAFYVPGERVLPARRESGRHHQFITVELARPFLRQHLGDAPAQLHGLVQTLLDGQSTEGGVGKVGRLTSRRLDLIRALRAPPVPAAARRAWYEARALDILVEFCFETPAPEMFCQRQLRLQRDRVAETSAILKRRLAEPPTLEALAREVGVSACYLSRTFSREMGVSITQYLRRLRLERAAELLLSGEYNVTEAAFEVGYNSLSHFSAAFHETYGVCPGLYSLAVAHGTLPWKPPRPAQPGTSPVRA